VKSAHSHRLTSHGSIAARSRGAEYWNCACRQGCRRSAARPPKMIESGPLID
jgi:hypothetical protein